MAEKAKSKIPKAYCPQDDNNGACRVFPQERLSRNRSYSSSHRFRKPLLLLSCIEIAEEDHLSVPSRPNDKRSHGYNRVPPRKDCTSRTMLPISK